MEENTGATGYTVHHLENFPGLVRENQSPVAKPSELKQAGSLRAIGRMLVHRTHTVGFVDVQGSRGEYQRLKCQSCGKHSLGLMYECKKPQKSQ
jgi:hypothetical protein